MRESLVSNSNAVSVESCRTAMHGSVACATFRGWVNVPGVGRIVVRSHGVAAQVAQTVKRAVRPLAASAPAVWRGGNSERARIEVGGGSKRIREFNASRGCVEAVVNASAGGGTGVFPCREFSLGAHGGLVSVRNQSRRLTFPST
jgi:hypothetical protein